MYYVGLLSLNPPGAFYPVELAKERDNSGVELVSTIDWESPVESPHFANDFIVYKEKHFRYTSVIVDIKSVNMNNNICSDVGWTIVPIFSADGYAYSGCF